MSMTWQNRSILIFVVPED